MKYLLGILSLLFLTPAVPVLAQSNWTVEGSIGTATPVADISSRLSTGFNFDVSGGRQITDWLSLLADFGYASMQVPTSVLQEVNAPVGHGRIVTLSLDPEVRFPLTRNLRGFAIGGAGWVHRAVDLTSPSIQYVDYYDPVYGDIPQPIETDSVISSVTHDAFGENIGGGLAYPVASIDAEVFASARYYHAPTSPRDTALVLVMFGIRWLPAR